VSLDTAGGAGAGAGGSYGEGGTLSDLFYPMYKRLFDEEGDFVSNVETKLAEARMPETVEIYLSRSLAVGVLVGLVLWLLGVFTGWFVFSVVLTEVPILLGLPVGESTASLRRSPSSARSFWPGSACSSSTTPCRRSVSCDEATETGVRSWRRGSQTSLSASTTAISSSSHSLNHRTRLSRRWR